MHDPAAHEATMLERDELLKEADLGNATDATQAIAKLLARRYSCRAYKADPVPTEKIKQLLAIAQLSASWCNAQPWQVIITEGAGTERFREAMYAHALSDTGNNSDYPFPCSYTGVYRERRLETASRLYTSVGVARGDREGSRKQGLENYRLFGAPHVMLLTSEENLGVYGAVDCGLFLGNFLLIAESMGIAAIPQAAFAVYSSFVREYFGFPPNRKVVCGISFGYAADKHPANDFRTSRGTVDGMLTWART